MEEQAAVAGAAQGDLADVVARAGAIMAAAPPSARHRHRPTPPSPAAADHMPSAAIAGHQIMMVPFEVERRPAGMACGDDAVMFEAPLTVDPYQLPSSATAPPPPSGGYWLPPQQLAVQISQHACYGHDAVMSGAVADVDGDEAMRISPVTPSAHHQIMKRKDEVKKVVCIPALPATSNRAGGGEVIPSDLWAWRKYGQKPIKGSPYPRGYYRCSSSKGCMARKQVERSRSDPNMLVITYTAEHNHPWPMQRNVLAGYSRPHTQVSTNCKKKSSCRVDPTSSSSSSSSKKTNCYSKQNAVIGSADLDFQQPTNMMMEGNAAGYGSCAIGALVREGAAVHETTQVFHNGIQQPADEVFAELEELEPSNPVNANNVYSRGVSSYEWHKF